MVDRLRSNLRPLLHSEESSFSVVHRPVNFPSFPPFSRPPLPLLQIWLSINRLSTYLTYFFLFLSIWCSYIITLIFGIISLWCISFSPSHKSSLELPLLFLLIIRTIEKGTYPFRVTAFRFFVFCTYSTRARIRFDLVIWLSFNLCIIFLSFPTLSTWGDIHAFLSPDFFDSFHDLKFVTERHTHLF